MTHRKIDKFHGKEIDPCPFCGGKLAVDMEDPEGPSLLHILPTCEQFNTMNSGEILLAIKRKVDSRAKA